MKKLLTIALLAFGVNAFAQSVNIKSQKNFGGSADESSANLIATKDGGFIMIGDTKSSNGDVSGNHGGSDAWVVKLDAGMNMQWQKSFGGNGDDYGYCIQQTTDGGYVFVTSDAYVMKIDSVGTLLWSKQYGYSLSSIEQTADGGFITSGNVTSASQGVTPVMMKLDDTGTVQWQKTIHVFSSIEWITSVHQTTDGGYIMAVWSVGTIYPEGKGQNDYVLLKTDSLGSVQWQKIYGGSNDDYVYDVIQTKDGGYIVTGSSSSKDKDVPYNSGAQDCWVIKLDTAGALMWTYVLGENRDDVGSSVIQTNDGGYVISGYSSSTDYDFKSNHGWKDCWAFKLDSTGILLWTRILGGSKDDYIGSMIQTANDEYVFAATTASNDGDVKGNHGGNDIWVVRLQEDLLSVAGVVADNSIAIYPNPTEDNLTIKLGAADKGALFSINDITGKKLKEGKLDAAVTVLSVKDLPAGVYLLCIEGRQPIKLVKQ